MKRLPAIASLSLTLAALACLGVAHVVPAQADGGTGATCTLSGISVTVEPSSQQTLYVYEVDCPGKPLGWFGGNAVAKYEVIGNWNWQTKTARDNVFSFDRNEGEFDTWICSDDPWITAAIYPNESGWPNGHTCQLQSQKGGDDWSTDTNPSSSFADTMCSNDPWGTSLAGCWSNDDLSVTGPTASLMLAWVSANATAGGKAPQAQSISPPLPGGAAELTANHEGTNAAVTPSPTPATSPLRVPVHVPTP